VLPPAAGATTAVGTKDFAFDVTADAARQIRAQIDGQDGDDYDLYLYNGSKAPENAVASSTSGTADEALGYDYPEPGRYILSVQNWLATGGWTGKLEVFGSVPGSETVVPAGIEAWTVTCSAWREGDRHRADRRRPRRAQDRDRLPQGRQGAALNGPAAAGDRAGGRRPRAICGRQMACLSG
jgi:Bacterial pre-peptidase C-terminal domain